MSKPIFVVFSNRWTNSVVNKLLIRSIISEMSLAYYIIRIRLCKLVNDEPSRHRFQTIKQTIFFFLDSNFKGFFVHFFETEIVLNLLFRRWLKNYTDFVIQSLKINVKNCRLTFSCLSPNTFY